jgi:hypothetical protein
MIVFNSKKTAILTFLILASSIVAKASIRFVGPGDGVQKDSIEGIIQDFTQHFDKTFAVNKNTAVVLSNKYGTIDVRTGNGSQVVVNVKITVSANTQAQADKVFDRINIAFSDGPNFIKTETFIENPVKTNIFLAGNTPPPTCDFRIDYEVTMPVGNRLELTNRHGNSTIAALKSSVKIDQKYGDFRLDGATSATVILAYGGGQLSELNTLYGNVSYGKLTSPLVRTGYLKSIYSQLRFDQIGSVEIQSNYDIYEINAVRILKADCKYSTINVRNAETVTVHSANTACKIQKIETAADFDCQQGTIRIGSLKNNFDHLTIEGTGTNCLVVVDPNISYLLDMTGTYSNMNQPASLHPKIDRNEAFRREVMGLVGNNPNTKSTVRVRMTYGEFKIK